MKRPPKSIMTPSLHLDLSELIHKPEIVDEEEFPGFRKGVGVCSEGAAATHHGQEVVVLQVPQNGRPGLQDDGARLLLVALLGWGVIVPVLDPSRVGGDEIVGAGPAGVVFGNCKTVHLRKKILIILIIIIVQFLQVGHIFHKGFEFQSKI